MVQVTPTISERSALVHEFTAELKDITQRTRSTFDGLTSKQLNWKPSAQQWSVAQCFDHLITSNKAYLPIFERAANGQLRNSLWEQMPILPALFGRLLIKSLDPKTSRKLKAPKLLQPASSDLDSAIVDRFISEQAELIRAIQKLEGQDLDALRMTSPIMGLITYSFSDACRIIIVHEQRHFQQAEHVLKATGFPGS